MKKAWQNKDISFYKWLNSPNGRQFHPYQNYIWDNYEDACFLFMCAVLNPTDGELPERDTGINMKKMLKEKG